MLFNKSLATFGRYLMLMGRTFSRPERMRMFFKQYIKEMSQLGVDSIGIVLLISFFIGAVICIQIKLNIQSPWMPKFVTGYTTREIMLLEFSSSIMCLILAGKVGSNIASELGTMRVTQQIRQLPHPAQGAGHDDHDALPGLFQYFLRIRRGLRHVRHRASHHDRRPDVGIATRLQRMVRMDGIHQVHILRHHQRIGVLRLYGRRRFGGSGKS